MSESDSDLFCLDGDTYAKQMSLSVWTKTHTPNEGVFLHSLATTEPGLGLSAVFMKIDYPV